MALPVDSFKRQLDSTLEASVKASNVRLFFVCLLEFVYWFINSSPFLHLLSFLFQLFIANRCPTPTTNCEMPYIAHFKMIHNRCFKDRQKNENEFFHESIMMTINQSRTGLKAIS